ncbi:alpha/beta hydrolase [Ketobacter sp. MCCC 1A13808]|uniref:alpha/beta hydrolase family protein n=1 Tax=Ketobacter sp. MCCC 1A13808 TaxID=2602738 RepID=UPI000F11A47C|nr:dienelactone hydrolase family protein [Ketobacter sp. MCCC 1A13808]MVF13069.1 alpha/beta hydrolase [Ketobacter sp. MCCC 1A13808]RLP53019.1 MAG: alpha/beta hydrolase [Ketobacter sp.]
MKKKLLATTTTLLASAMLSASVFALTDPPVDPVDPVDPTDPPSSDNVRGPDPTESALESTRGGPYSVRTQNVSSLSARGFGGGTIHYPTNAGTNMGAIAVVPGFVSYENSIEWWGSRLASWGFVVITIDTNTTVDQPDSRADQLSAALDLLVSESNSGSSAISGLVDPSRLGAIGWSMGGGGSLKLATERNLKAIIPQAPWYTGSSTFRRLTTPTMIIACEADVVAPVGQHASPFYNAIPDSTPKAFLEINGGSHFCANSGYSDEDLLGKYGIAWMKRFMDDDTRYSQFLCGPNHESNRNISEYRDTCNY